MSRSDDHPDEMGMYDDAEFEALLQGRTPAGSDLGTSPFADVVDDLRLLARGAAPRPSAELQRVLAAGLVPTDARLTADKGDLPVTAASNVHGPALGQVAGLPTRRRKTMKEVVAGIIGKVAGLGAAAKVALAAGVVAASAGGMATVASVTHTAPEHVVISPVSSESPAPEATTDTSAPDATQIASPEPDESTAPEPSESPEGTAHLSTVTGDSSSSSQAGDASEQQDGAEPSDTESEPSASTERDSESSGGAETETRSDSESQVEPQPSATQSDAPDSADPSGSGGSAGSGDSTDSQDSSGD